TPPGRPRNPHRPDQRGRPGSGRAAASRGGAARPRLAGDGRLRAGQADQAPRSGPSPLLHRHHRLRPGGGPPPLLGRRHPLAPAQAGRSGLPPERPRPFLPVHQGLRRVWAWLLADGSAGLVVVLLIDPTRDLRPVFVLLAVAVGTLLAWRFCSWRK